MSWITVVIRDPQHNETFQQSYHEEVAEALGGVQGLIRDLEDRVGLEPGEATVLRVMKTKEIPEDTIYSTSSEGTRIDLGY